MSLTKQKAKIPISPSPPASDAQTEGDNRKAHSGAHPSMVSAAEALSRLIIFLGEPEPKITQARPLLR